MSQGRRRSIRQSPHHECDCCKREFLLTELTWQEGHLRCKDCFDTMTVGEREAMIATAFSVPSKELQPDDKLVNSSVGQASDSIFFIL